jgi:hypothetical protein
MPIRVVPHSAEYRDAVLDFNARMRAGGSKWGFYVDPEPDWIPKREDVPVWREYHLAVEDESHVRGGYALKPQRWLLGGKPEWVTDWQGPFTEGAVDVRYSALALRLLRDMLKKYPLLYSTGHGGSNEPMVLLLRTLGWTLYPMPFCFRILRPYRFLRSNAYLRTSLSRRLSLDALAVTGVGPLGIRALHTLQGIRRGRRRGRAVATVVDEFGDWADDVWREAHASYECIAVRDSAMMNRLLPRQGWPGGVRLKVERGGSVIGWSVVHAKRMKNDPRFGSLSVAQVSDCFAAPADAHDVIAATHSYVASVGIDLICSNQSHRAWVDGFERCGYVTLENRRLFAVSPQLQARMEPIARSLAGLHLTNMDGHGPHGFTDAD